MTNRAGRSPSATTAILTSIHAPADSPWNARAEVVSSREHSSWTRWMSTFLRAAPGKQAIIVRGTTGWSQGYRDLLAAGLLRRLFPRQQVIVSDATIEPGSRALEQRLPKVLRGLPARVSLSVVRFVDGRNVTWCVLSSEEVESFPRVWGLPRANVVFTPFSHTIYDQDLLDEPGPVGDFLFAGGNSLRDFNMLLSAVQGLDVPVKVATKWRPASPLANVSFQETSSRDFLTLMRTSRAVVVPLEVAVRGTGQQTYLNAMALGKVVIVNDVPGVRDHVEDGVTGVVVRDAAGMRAAIEDVLSPARADHYRAMAEAARRRVLADLTPEHYRLRLLQLASELQPAIVDVRHAPGRRFTSSR